MTDEERKAKKREYNKRYREEHREELSLKNKIWRENNKEWQSVVRKAYRERNKEYIHKRLSEWRSEHREEARNYAKGYRETKFGKAKNLLASYRVNDKRYGRETTITEEWIISNIFNSSCVYCGEQDWHKLGCDRIYSPIGHIPENIVCSCGACNVLRGTKPFLSFVNRPWMQVIKNYK